MRAFFSLLLVATILVCPSFCRAAETSCCAEHEEASGTQDEGTPKSPLSPGESVNCICGGAIKEAKSDNATLAFSGSFLPLFPVFLLSTLHADPSLLQFLSRNGAPPGLGHAPNRLQLHVLLMTFRC
ncbi:hypothetical protein V5E97_32010 [Singulisphaera sp. Ch08]|uniref:Secreted protein n=1 Tax=Singulisphaera sp. Ch08 TaxID=3120278 RepID=A0AAU7CCE4_9BACT